MVKVSYGQLRDHNFGRGMSKLANFPGFKTPAIAYNVAKINARCIEEAKLADQLFKNLLEPLAVKDKDGGIAPANGVPGTFEIKDECQAEWKSKLDAFLAHEVEIDRPRILLSDLGECQLTPLEIDALDSFLSTLEAV